MGSRGGDDEEDHTATQLKSERKVRDELLFARGRPSGLSPQTMAQCPVMCAVLGNGDPEVAHVQLSLKLMELIEADDDVMAIEAACYSLGLTTPSDTHLQRLEEFGSKYYIDQRQARRYSDRGVAQLARLIATNWTTQTVPEATTIIIGMGGGQVGFTIRLRCQRHVDMRHPKVGIWPASQKAQTLPDIAWQRTSEPDALWIEDEFVTPQVLSFTEETTIRLVWRGEVWPKFTVVLTGAIDADLVTTETLGAACAVSINPS